MGIRQLKGTDEPVVKVAYGRALGILAHRDQSVAEMEKKLSRRGYLPETIAKVMAKLVEQGLLDDRRFAARWVEAAARSGRGYGARLVMELRRRGVSRDMAQEAVAALADEMGEQQLLAEVAVRRFASFDPSSAGMKERQRVYGYLQRRGFTLGAICAYFRDFHTGVTDDG